MRQTINAPIVIAEDIDGEVIILNMESGKYFSTQGSGAAIWQLLSNGCDDETATADLAEHYRADRQAIAAAVTELRAFFTAENLLRALAPGESTKPISLDRVSSGEFAQPEISSHTDMQGLLLLDPIHEVEDMGWPHKPVDLPS